MRSSVSRSSLPMNSMLPMEGRSTTDTTSVLAIAFKAHVTEKSGLEQRTDGSGGARAVYGVSDLESER